MIDLPPLNTVVSVLVSREGGFAYIPALSAPRRYLLGQCSDDLRSHITHALREAAAQVPQEAAPERQADHRFFRVELLCDEAASHARTAYSFDVPEERAPTELVKLWSGQLVP